MRRALRPASVSFVLMLFLCAPWPALAQSNDPISANLTFNFGNPGARSLALGGAFTALADDATAAYANPAGLTNLPRKQVALEFRRSTIDSRFVSGGSFDSSAPDPFAGVTFGEHSDSSSRPAFVSLMLPRGRWAIGAYRHELSRFSNETRNGPIGINRNPQLTVPQAEASLRLDIVNYGLSAAFSVNDLLSVGGGLSYFRNSLSVLRANVGTTAFAASRADENAIGGNVGFLLKPDRWSIGGSYKRGPAFDVFSEVQLPFGNLRDEGTKEFKIPDVLALGVAYRFSNTFVIAADIQEVKYKSLTEDLFIAFPDDRPLLANSYRVEDVDEFHLGAEKVFIRTRPSIVAIRFGAWYEPVHRVRYVGPDAPSLVQFPGGESQVHATAGIGLVFGTAFQIDAGIDYAKNSRIFSVSLVKPF